MTRQNSNFVKLIEHEQDRAVDVFDSTALQSDVKGYFSYEYPDTFESRLNTPAVMTSLELAELEAMYYLENSK